MLRTWNNDDEGSNFTTPHTLDISKTRYDLHEFGEEGGGCRWKP